MAQKMRLNFSLKSMKRMSFYPNKVRDELTTNVILEGVLPQITMINSKRIHQQIKIKSETHVKVVNTLKVKLDHTMIINRFLMNLMLFISKNKGIHVKTYF